MNPDQPPPVTSTAVSPSWMAPVTPVVPDHEMIRRIGGGSYGDVWLARTAVGTWRAVKVVFRDRFLDSRPYDREFHGIQKFEPLSRSNEGFIDILQIGRNEEAGYFYYVMELADDATELGTQSAESTLTRPAGTLSPSGGEGRGEGAAAPVSSIPHTTIRDPHSYVPLTLSKALLQRGRLPVNECLSLGLTLNLALAHLHRVGLIHRDIKPSNIIFVAGVPKLADIGLVVETSEARSYVGTEGFIPPEGPTSPQADLYSLGKVLYEAGMGKDRKDFPEPMTKIAEAPDSEQLLEFNAILLKACAANVKDRYQSAEEMNADLALLQSGGSVRRQRKLSGQLRFVQRVAAIVTGLAALIAAGWLWQARQTHIVRELVGEKTRLVEEKGRLANENRERVLQLDLANGIQHMESGDLGRAMLWFADSLKFATNDPAQVELSQFRLSKLLQIHPKLVAILDARSGTNISDRIDHYVDRNGRRMLLVTDRRIELWNLTKFPLQQLAAVPDGTNWDRYVISPDGQRFAISSKLRGTQVWIGDSNNTFRVMTLPEGPLRHVRFSTDSESVYGVNSNRALVRLDAGTGTLLGQVASFEMPLETLTISGDGRRVAAMMTNHQVRVMELDTGKVVGEFNLGRDGALSAIDAHGRFIISRFANDQAHRASYATRIWDVATASVIGAPMPHGGEILSVIASPDGRLVLSCGKDRTARVWNQFTGDPLAPPLQHAATVLSADFSPDGARVATGDRDGRVVVWDPMTGRPLTPPLLHDGIVDPKFALGGAMLVTASVDGLVRFWSLLGSESEEAASALPSVSGSVCFSPDGETMLLRKETAHQLWRTRDWQRFATIDRSADAGAKVRFSSDSRYLATPSGFDSVRVWDTRTGEPASPVLKHIGDRVRAVAFSPDARILASAGEKGQVRLWDWREGRDFTPALQHTGVVVSVEFSPRGDRLLTSSLDDGNYWTRLWDLASGSILRQLKQSPEMFNLIEPSFDATGQRFLAGRYQPGNVMVCDATTGSRMSPILHHDDSIRTACFSPDGRTILTAGYDAKARLWEAATSRLMVPAMVHPRDLVKAEFSANGRLVATLTIDGALQLWDASNGLALTPPLPTPVSSFVFQPHGSRLAITTLFGEHLWLEDLRSSLPPELMEPLVKLATGRSILSDGLIKPLPLLELLELDQRLRAALPERFAISADQLLRWHMGQVGDRSHLNQIATEIYHKDQALALQPTNSEARELRARLVAALPASRDVLAPRNLIDLTDLYDHSIDSFGAQDMPELPRGRQRLAGTEFDIRGVVALASPPVRGLKGRVSGASHIGFIRVAQRCRQLHFLQGGMGGASIHEGEEVMRFIIHYADGSQRSQPMLYGRHLRNWWRFEGSPHKVSDAVVAWEGHWEPAARSGATVRFYKATWENPTPDVEVSHLEVQFGVLAVVRPLVVAITAE